MPKDETQGGHNLTKLKADIADAYCRVGALKLDRESANEAISAIRADLETKGIKKEAFDMAIRYANWDEDKREGFDIAYQLVREAIDMPMNAQGDLFDKKDEDSATDEAA